MKKLKYIILIVGVLLLFSCECGRSQNTDYKTQTSAIINVDDKFYSTEFECYNTFEVVKVGDMKYIIFSKTSYDGGLHVVNYTLDSLKVESLKR